MSVKSLVQVSSLSVFAMCYTWILLTLHPYLTPVCGILLTPFGIGKGVNTGDGTAILTGIGDDVTSIGTGPLDHGTEPSIFEEVDASLDTQTPKHRTEAN